MTSSATIAAVYRQLSLHKPGLTQCINRNQTRSLAVGEPIPSFEALGIRTPIAAAVRAAFPNVSVPTETQSKFIPAIMSGSDVLLKDEPGTGKSFGLILALLSKSRVQQATSGKAPRKNVITSLMIVPHRDLVGQFWHWIHKTANAPTVRTPLRMPSICQILVRDEASPLISRISALRDEPPHILIGTPQALMDIWNEDRDALQLESLSAVVVDEVDYLIESVPRKPSRIMMERARRKIDRHPSATRQLLDIIYGPRVKAGSNDRNELGAKKHTMPRLPQLIMSSATLRNHLKIYLFNESGWLRKERLQKVVGLPTFLQQNLRRRGTEVRGDIAAEADWESRPEAVNEKRDGVGRIRISHFVLVVSGNGDTKNIDGATRREDVDNAADVVVKEDRKAITPETVFEAQEAQTGPAIDNKLEEKFGNTPAPFDLNGFEAIATAFALDVPSIALLVLPASAPVQRVIYELRKMGVDAHGVDLYGKGRERLLYGGGEVRSAKENPILLVSTLATTRGLDFPELSHVFILGVPEGGKIDGRSMDSYLHIAGRVGRFGRNGKVITVVEDADDLEGMKVILKELRIKPSRFEYFD